MFEGESLSQEQKIFTPDVVDQFLESYYDALSIPLDDESNLPLNK